jgi:ribulose-5-phosphate 4-epimerase/fuculose-1-phosphate aldolase
MTAMFSTTTPRASEDTETKLRTDLAAAFRLAALFDWHESVGNHFSAALPDGTFLLNPKWRHFTEVRASELLKLDPLDRHVLDSAYSPDPTAWCIHGAVHRLVPRAKVLLHCHPPYATTLCTLRDPAIYPIEQNTARFFQRTAIDLAFGGIADDIEEGERIAKTFGTADVLLMGNHGVSVIGETVALAFETLFLLERASRSLVLAYSTGQPLNVMPPDLAEKTARGWEAYRDMGTAHFEQLKVRLDRSDRSYRD